MEPEKNIPTPENGEKDTDIPAIPELPFTLADYETGNLALDNLDHLFADDTPENPAFARRQETIYTKPRRWKFVDERFVRYERAQDFVRDIALDEFREGDRLHALLSGKFIMGDLFEAYVTDTEAGHGVKSLSISTLSLNKDNIDSMRNIIEDSELESLDLIVSLYWYVQEGRKRGMDYIMEQCGLAEKFRFAIAGIHTKIALMETRSGQHLVFSGSANLRSCRQVEQLCIECDSKLYMWYRQWFATILRDYAVHHKQRYGGDLWRVLQADQAEAEAEAGGGSTRNLKPQPSAAAPKR